MSAGRHKPRLGPWLVAQVDGGRYPGLHWLDTSRTRFRVPWPQVCRGDAASEPCALYRSWAVTSRKFVAERDAPDPPKWKTNLRCALNKSRDFRCVHDASREPQPYKVYEWCVRLAHGGAQALGSAEFKEEYEEEEEEEDEEENTMSSTEPATSPDSIPCFTPHGDGGVLGEHPGACTGMELSNNIASLTLLDSQVTHFLSGWEPDPSTFQPSGERPPATIGGPPHLMVNVEVPPGPADPSAVHFNPEVCEAPVDVPPMGDPGGFRGVPHISLPPESDLEVQVEYRGERVLPPVTVSGVRGCRLYSGNLALHRGIAPQHDALLGPTDYQQIAFPSPACIPERRQRDLTERVLQFTERGLLLEAHGGRLRATRLGQSRVYWSRGRVGPGATARLLERETPTELLDFQAYITELLACLQEGGGPGGAGGGPGGVGGGPEFPDPRVLLCFGEEWPDPQRPRHKKLIMVQVVPTAMRMLRELAEGAPLCSVSLNSDQLQISGQNENDGVVAYLRHILQQQQQQQQLMQQQQQLQQQLQMELQQQQQSQLQQHLI